MTEREKDMGLSFGAFVRGFLEKVEDFFCFVREAVDPIGGGEDPPEEEWVVEARVDDDDGGHFGFGGFGFDCDDNGGPDPEFVEIA